MVEENKGKAETDVEDGRTTFNKLKGMKVYDADGKVFGHVSDIEINKSTLSPTKLVIHKGFFGEYLRINLKYIEKIARDAIHLWISPIKNLVGAKVLDSEGEEIGEVKEAEKGKDGELEYIRMETKVIRTRNEYEEEIDSYTVPMLSFEDMSVTLPTPPLEEDSVATSMDLNQEDIYIEAEEITDVGRDCIKLKKEREEYI